MNQDGMLNANQKYNGTLNRNSSYTNNRQNGLNTEETEVHKTEQKRKSETFWSSVDRIEDISINNKVDAPILI